MKATVLVRRLRPCHVLVRLPYLVTFPLHKEFQAAVILLSGVTSLRDAPLLLASIVVNH